MRCTDHIVFSNAETLGKQFIYMDNMLTIGLNRWESVKWLINLIALFTVSEQKSNFFGQ